MIFNNFTEIKILFHLMFIMDGNYHNINPIPFENFGRELDLCYDNSHRDGKWNNINSIPFQNSRRELDLCYVISHRDGKWIHFLS